MLKMKHQLSACALAVGLATAWGGFTAHAARTQDDRENRSGNGDDRRDGRVKTVFVVAMENHNWTQPATTTSPQAIFMNAAAPFINSLVNGTSGISDRVSYAANYINAGTGVHPSEPNYIWAEAGDNLGVANDDNPYHTDCSPDTIQSTPDHLSAYLTRAGKTWRSYQEDANVDASNVPLAKSAWTVPLFSVSGLFSSGTNGYFYTSQYNYAAKHNPMVFFADTNGGCPSTASTRYPPLQQLALDLQNDAVADYNWITPDQFNDQHTSLANGGTGCCGYGKYTSSNDAAKIAQGDNFLARIVPLIIASKAYKDHGVIVLWWDESEGGDTSEFTLPFMIISNDAHANVGGKPHASSVEYSHSSFVRTMQKIFHVDPPHGYNWLRAAGTANDLSDMFKPGVIN
jgi:phosphatidylinositol-3-phosphatase